MVSFRRQLLWLFLLVAVVSAGVGAAVMLVLLLYGRATGAVDQLAGLVLDLTQLARPLVDRWGTGPVLTGGVLVAVLVVLVVAAGLSALATRRVVRPVAQVSTAARHVAEGDLSVRLQPRGDDELASLVRSFNEMTRSLDRQVRRLEILEAQARRFAGDVSHELRTPVATMTAVAEVLEPEIARMTPDAARAAALVIDSTHRMRVLVDDILEISRFDAGSQRLVPDEVDLPGLVAATLGRRGWGPPDVVTDVEPVVAGVDARRVDVVLANLVSNALRHGAPPVEVTVRTDGDVVVLAVRDHGAGVPDDAVPHVFERFWKADAGRARSEGSGLGLAIAAENAALHGGGIEVARHPGGGALFTAWVRTVHATHDDPAVTSAGSTGA